MPDHTPKYIQPQLTFDEIPYGYCACGCGEKTKLAPQSSVRKGWIRGEPMRYISHHYSTPPVYASIAEYFWTYAVPGDPDICWEWQGAKTEAGYGVMNWLGKMYYAHRTSWEIANSKPIPEDKFACHECDNRGCVNPHHIWSGGVKDNSEDMVSKGRQARGERCAHAKLTDSDISAIRQRAATGEMFKEIAKDYGCHGSYIGQIVHGKRWAHVR